MKLAIRTLIGTAVVAVVAASAASVRVTAQEPSTSPAALVIAGANNFKQYCVACHGADAKGGGPLAKGLTPKPADLTAMTQRNGGTYPRDMVFQVIDGRKKVKGHGGGDMPEWGEAFLISAGAANADAAKRRIESLVEYLATLQGK